MNDAPSQPGHLAPGTVFQGRYEIVRPIAGGGMGTVYECVHLATRRRRALKVMLPQIVSDPTARARFELEARITAAIESEHIVETFDAGVDDATGSPFLVMELLRGEDVATLLKRRGRLSPEDVVVLLGQAARAIDKTHAASIVHRDLKPENLFLTTREDGSPRVKILDYGIAKVVEQSHRGGQATGLIGTPLYMSPEQIGGEGTLGPASDLYALGHIAFTMLCGVPYWDDEDRSGMGVYTFLVKVMQGAPELPSIRARRRGATVPPSLDAWFVRACAPRPGDRHGSAAELVSDLAAALGVAVETATYGGEGLGDGSCATSSPLGASAGRVPSGTVAASPAAAGPGFTQVGGPPVSAQTSYEGPETTRLGTSLGSRTGTPVIRDAPRADARVAPRRGRAAVGVGLAIAGIALVVGLVASRGGSAEPAPHAVAGEGEGEGVTRASPTVVGASRSAPAATAAAETLPGAPSTDPPPAVVPLAASPEVTPSASAPPASATTPPRSSGRRAPAGRPPAPPPPAAATTPSCTPPYTLDASGIRHIKPGCG